MNLFAVGWSSQRRIDAASPTRALSELLEQLPFLPGARIEGWTAPSGFAAAASAAHAPEQTGGVRYARFEPERMALFSGRPFRWTGEAEADGKGPLDPASYLPPAERWSDGLEGRCVVARYGDADRALEVFTDPLGAYPVFTSLSDGVRWVSNSPVVLRTLGATAGARPLVLASLLGGGWSLSGDPVWEGVRRLEPGLHRFCPAGTEWMGNPLEPQRVAPLLGRGADPGRAARTLVAAVRALADWPGRPSTVPVTGGRDSRLVLAAALRAGIGFSATTGGGSESADVRIGRLLCERAGVAHELLEADPHGDMWSAPERMARLVALTAGGTASAADAAGFPLGPRSGPLVLWHSGQGGEIARGYYGLFAGGGRENLVERLYASFVGRRTGRAELLGADGRALVEAELARFVDAQVGADVPLEDVPDMFYLQRRMATWAAPTHGCVEWVKDTTSPLWCARLLPDELGWPAAERARELFHLSVLRELRPDLVDAPFEGGRPWPARQGEAARRARRARSLAVKAAGELRRRMPHPRRARPAGGDAGTAPFATVLGLVRDAVLERPGHPAWDVLDRARVERLLARDAHTLDTMSRYYVWRLGTVFVGDLGG